jgi:putative membrane protein
LFFAAKWRSLCSLIFAAIMQLNQKKNLRFLGNWLINTLAVVVAVEIVPGIHFNNNGFLAPFVTSLVLGILNAFVRPILMFLALPLLIFTLGLFTFVINALLLYLVGQLPFFHVDSFGAAFLGALIISVVSIVLNIMTGNARVTVQHRPSPKKDDDDDKPVIDV